MRTDIPEILNPLKHAGTNRFERLAKEMAFDYVQIEERHEADFLSYAEKLTGAFQYYDEHNLPFGNWQSFFDQSVPSNRPHKALFIAFLRLLEALNDYSNGLTKRHLDYYYREVLQFADREAKPDQVHLFFKCAKALKERFVAKGTLLEAGDADNGKKILYELVDELIVNKAEVVSFYSVFRHSDDFKNRLFAQDYSAYLSGGMAESNGFPAFGENQLTAVKVDGQYQDQFKKDFTMVPAEVGFAISTPLLRMKEGTRTINLKLDANYQGGLNLAAEQFTFLVTSEKGWLTVKNCNVESLGAETLSIVLTVENDEAGIVNYDAELHGGAYRTKYPVLKVVLAHQDTDYAYLNWKDVQLKNVRMSVGADGVRSLLVQNELSTLDPSKPMRPFGPLPGVGDHFYIGHSDIFKNKLATVDFHFKWKDIEYANFSDHYANYSLSLDNNSFKVALATLKDKVWKANGTSNLFGSSAYDTFKMGVNTSDFDRILDEEELTEWNYNTKHGFVRLTLTQPKANGFNAFGHRSYPKEVMRVNQLNLNETNPANKIELSQPYTPVIEALTLDYTTAETTFSDVSIDHFYHVTHYGQKELELGNELVENKLLPQFIAEGECYIGLEHLELPQSVTLLFQLNEGSGDANLSQINSGIQWYYLVGNDWKPFDKLRISKDTTRNLLNTGIIRFDLPEEMDIDHEIMPAGRFWLKACVPTKSAGIDRIQSIYAQVVEAQEQDADLKDETLSPYTVSKMADGSKGIMEMGQPYASFGGTNRDSEEQFYARITERLRHKDRGIMIWDYERLVLDEFPDLYKVKCLNHTNYQTELVAGHVMMAVIPNLRKKGIHSPFQPKLSIHKRMEIYDFLRERISPFIYLRVENPVYEPIQLSFNVGFHVGYDEGFYGKKLHQQLQEFLSPWAFEQELNENSDLVFGGELHKSTILKFIEDLEYVDFVNDFNMYHIYRDGRVASGFEKPELPVDLKEENDYTWHIEEGPCDRFKMKFQVENSNEPNILVDFKLRFLKGLVELDAGETLKGRFIRQFRSSVARRVKKGTPITKNLIQILIKNMFYVDKTIELQFYKELPDDYVMADVDVAIAKTSRSIMVTANQHRIGVYRAGDYNCEGSVVIGIGFMIVEADFIIPHVNEQNYEYTAR